MRTLWRWIRGIVRFLIDYIFGDDWTVAALIAIGLLATWGLVRAGVPAWWVLPPVVIGATVQSLLRSVRRDRG